ncbi:hypothetical protein AYO21_04356 [Fonsecaea monophora]|uniref:Major facilitator superfamily (MFS) profile domain-containing protein n=1 Tax=Fonsecaea monophora TaxID=254056 RepID=A0A177FAZ1_9EURO|nr:hypothetical protein AYO21_04356 [Fonsecaea monophora]OAG41414.1 hypothetical protein AYO21_04356 [Fonsecaea monophora]
MAVEDQAKTPTDVVHDETKADLSDGNLDRETAAPDEANVKIGPRVYLALLALALTYEAALFSFVVPSAVLLTINNDLGPSPDFTWISTTWSLSNAILQSIAGRFTDIFGRRYFLIAGSVLGFVGTLVAGRANTISTVIAGTTLMGVGASTQQIAYAAAFDIVPRKHRGTVLAAMNFAALPGSMFGAVIGFNIVKTLTWRYTFYFGCLANGLSFLTLVCFYWPPGWVGLHPDGKSRKQQIRELDYVCVVLFGGGLIAFLLGVGWGGNPTPWISAKVLAPLLIGAVTLIVAVPLWERYSDPKIDKLFPPELMTRFRTVVLPLVCLFCNGVVSSGLSVSTSYTIPQTCVPANRRAEVQRLFTTEPGRAGWLSFCMNGAGTTGIIVSGSLFGIVKYTKYQLIVYAVFQCAFTAAMASITRDSLARAVVLCLIAKFTIAGSSIIATLFVQFGAGDTRLGAATGIRGTLISAGGSIGLAICTSVVGNKVRESLSPALVAAVVDAGLPADSAAGFITAFVSGKPGALDAVIGATPEVIEAATRASQAVYADAFSLVYLITIVFTGAALICTFFIPSVDHHLTKHTAVQLDKAHIVGHGEGEAKVFREEDSEDGIEKSSLPNEMAGAVLHGHLQLGRYGLVWPRRQAEMEG